MYQIYIRQHCTRLCKFSNQTNLHECSALAPLRCFFWFFTLNGAWHIGQLGKRFLSGAFKPVIGVAAPPAKTILLGLDEAGSSTAKDIFAEVKNERWPRVWSKGV